MNTNEHLLQEINIHRYEKKPATGRFLGNDMNLYESTHESIGVPLFQVPTNGQMAHQTLPINSKLLVRKQPDQFNTLNNGLNGNRFTYSTVK